MSQFLDGIGDDESTGRATAVPESFYPMSLTLDCVEPSTKTGTPGIYLVANITDGPYAGIELDKYASCLWAWPPRPSQKGYERNLKQRLGFLKHWTKTMTGKDVDGSALEKHGCEAENEEEFWTWYAELQENDDQALVLFLADFLRLDEWKKGTDVIAKVSMETEPAENSDGEKIIDDDGNQVMRDRNSIVNIFPLYHSRYGLATWKKTHAKAQEKMFKAQFGE